MSERELTYEEEQARRAEALGRLIEEARERQTKAADARRELFTRCIGDSNPPLFITYGETTADFPDIIQNLLSSVDRLEKRIAELEARSP